MSDWELKKNRSFNEHLYWKQAFSIAKRAFAFDTLNKIGIKRFLELILAPINQFTRYGEYSLFEEFLELRSGLDILDVGSPKMFSLLLLERFQCNYVLTDKWEEDLMNWKFIAKKARLEKDNVKFLPVDGRSTGFPDNSFDRIYLMSVLEHIPDTGDTKTIIEMSRLLRDSGILVISIPASDKPKHQFSMGEMYGERKKKRKSSFFQRIYDWESINRRLISPSGLEMETVLGLGIKSSFLMRFFSFNYRVSIDVISWRHKLAFYAALPFGFMFPLISKFWRLYGDPEQMMKGPYYCDIVMKLRKNGIH